MLSHLFKRKPLLKLRVDDPSSIELRPYSKETDYQAVIDMIGSRFPEAGAVMELDGYNKDLTDVDTYWRQPGGEFMVLTKAGKVVGSICVRPVKGERGHAEFDYFFLARNEEAKGLGLMLMKWGFQWCRDHNIMIIEMWSNEERTTSHKLYRKVGFVDNGIRKPYPCGSLKGIHQIYFELDLTDEKKLLQLEQTIQLANF